MLRYLASKWEIWRGEVGGTGWCSWRGSWSILHQAGDPSWRREMEQQLPWLRTWTPSSTGGQGPAAGCPVVSYVPPSSAHWFPMSGVQRPSRAKPSESGTVSTLEVVLDPWKDLLCLWSWADCTKWHMFSKRFPRGEESRPQPHPFSSLPQMTQLKPFVFLQEWVLRKRLYRLPPPSEKAVSTRPALPLDVAQVSPRPRALFQTWSKMARPMLWLCWSQTVMELKSE